MIDPATGATKAIDTGDYDLANGDGLLLKGKTLYVVQNRSNRSRSSSSRTTWRRPRSSRRSRTPISTSPRRSTSPGKHLYAVNARFGTSTPADQHYDVVKVG